MKNKNDHQTEEWGGNLAAGIGKAAGILFTYPYKEIWRRTRLGQLRFTELVICEFIFAIFFFLILDPYLQAKFASWSFSKKHILLGILNIRQYLYAYLIFHLFYSFLGMLFQREKERYERKLKALKFVDENKKPLTYMGKIKYDGKKFKLIFKNSHYTSEELSKIKEKLSSAFLFDVRSVDYLNGKNRAYIEICNFEKIDGQKILLTRLLQKEKFSKEEFIVGVHATIGIIKISLKKMIHLLVGGETGSGKTLFLNQLITTLISQRQDLIFYLIDLKGGVGFQIFENMKNVRLIDNTQRAVELLREIRSMVFDRIDLLREYKVSDIRDLSKPPQRIVLVIDEAHDLFSERSSSSHDAKEARDLINEITAKARAVGIHVILSTQNPTKLELPTSTKANLNCKIAFKTGTIDASVAILDRKFAAELPNQPGVAIWREGLNFTKIQVPYIPNEECREFLKSYIDPTYKAPPTRKQTQGEKREDVRNNKFPLPPKER